MPWGAVAGAAISTIGGAISGGGQSSAISAGQQQANAVSQAAIDESRKAYAPYVSTGQNGLMALADLSGINGSDAATRAMGNFTASPGYQYQVDQGMKAVDAGAASRGLLRSGATLTAEQTLGSNLANQDFGNYMNRLGSLAGLGLDGTKAFTGVLSGQSNQIASTDTSAAGQQAKIAQNTGNSITNGLTTGTNSLFQYGTDAGWFGKGAAGTTGGSLMTGGLY